MIRTCSNYYATNSSRTHKQQYVQQNLHTFCPCSSYQHAEVLFDLSQSLSTMNVLDMPPVLLPLLVDRCAVSVFPPPPVPVHHHGSKMLRSESNSSITQSPLGWQISNLLTVLHDPDSGMCVCTSTVLARVCSGVRVS